MTHRGDIIRRDDKYFEIVDAGRNVNDVVNGTADDVIDAIMDLKMSHPGALITFDYDDCDRVLNMDVLNEVSKEIFDTYNIDKKRRALQHYDFMASQIRKEIRE